MDNRIDALLYQKKEKQKAIENLYEITDQNLLLFKNKTWIQKKLKH